MLDNLKAVLYSILYGIGFVGAFVLALLALYIIARVVTLAYFKSRQEHENLTKGEHTDGRL